MQANAGSMLVDTPGGAIDSRIVGKLIERLKNGLQAAMNRQLATDAWHIFQCFTGFGQFFLETRPWLTIKEMIRVTGKPLRHLNTGNTIQSLKRTPSQDGFLHMLEMVITADALHYL